MAKPVPEHRPQARENGTMGNTGRAGGGAVAAIDTVRKYSLQLWGRNQFSLGYDPRQLDFCPWAKGFVGCVPVDRAGRQAESASPAFIRLINGQHTDMVSM